MQRVIIGLTGPTGAGKSTVSRVAEQLGIAVIDADKTVRLLQQKGSPLLQKLKNEFGDILHPDGTLDRQKLAKAAFCSAENTEKLNSVMLPAVIAEIEKTAVHLTADGGMVLLDAPTLFESGFNEKCSYIIGVLSRKEERLKRIMSRDGITKEAAELRINAGKPDSFFTENCNTIIYNNSTDSELCAQAKKLFEELAEKFL